MVHTQVKLMMIAGGLWLTGCASPSFNQLGMFPDQQQLLQSAKAISQSADIAGQPRELDKQVLPAYIVEPGDVLIVQPVSFDSPVRLPADQPVLPDGTINLGMYGNLVVAGKTVPDIEMLVRAAVAAQTKDAGPILVRLVTRQSKVYYVLGSVNAPGAFPLAGRETVLDALLMAGGLSDRASKRDIILSRPTHPCGERLVLPICYSDIVQLGDTTTNYQIQPGDRIFVGTRCFLEDLLPHKHKSQGVRTPCAPPPVYP